MLSDVFTLYCFSLVFIIGYSGVVKSVCSMKQADKNNKKEKEMLTQSTRIHISSHYIVQSSFQNCQFPILIEMIYYQDFV